MAEATTFHTGDSVRELMEQAPAHWPRHETVYGELLVTPAPGWPHERVIGRLFRLLAAYAEREGIGEAVSSPADISWGGPDVLVQPDLFVVPREQAGGSAWASVTHLLLAVEVTSPGSQRADHFTKRRLYQAQGVLTYWMIDVDDAAVHVWAPHAELPVVERERLVWHPTGGAVPLTLPLAELFRLH